MTSKARKDAILRHDENIHFFNAEIQAIGRRMRGCSAWEIKKATRHLERDRDNALADQRKIQEGKT
jgi:hypothetical protein